MCTEARDQTVCFQRTGKVQSFRLVRLNRPQLFTRDALITYFAANSLWLTSFASTAVYLLNDLHVFDPVEMAWTDLSSSVAGTPPSARAFHGFASVAGMLYVHDGEDYNGNCSREDEGV